MNSLVCVLIFCLPGVLPAIAIAGMSPSAAFLAPLFTAVEAGLAATMMFLTAGSLLDWLLPVVALSNIVGAAFLWVGRQRTRSRVSDPLVAILGLVALVAAAGWPLLALRAPIIGYDAEAIWLLHSVFIFDGHHVMYSSLTNVSAPSNNPDYPPLLPASIAFSYRLHGAADQYLGVGLTAFLNSAAMALVGTGLLRLLPAAMRRWHRLLGILVIAGFMVSAYSYAGIYAVNGYADLLWGTAALGAVVYGLVLPRTRANLLVAVLCVEASTMTKNEGLVIGLFIAGILSLRYFGLRPSARSVAAGIVTGALALAGGVGWYLVARANGIGDAFFSANSGESTVYRLRVTASGMWSELHLLPVALGVTAVGLWFLRRARRTLGVSLAALWLVFLWALVAFVVTYTVGAYEIHWWMMTSVDRTAIFLNLCLLLEIGIWVITALGDLSRPTRKGRHYNVEPDTRSVPQLL